MQTLLWFVATLAVLCASPAVGNDSGPLQFLFSRCPPAGDDSDVGECVAAPLREALARQQQHFTTGVSIGGQKRVLEPLSVPGTEDSEQSPPRWSITDVQLQGLSSTRLGQVQLTRQHVAVQVSAEQLTARLTLRVKLGFLPLRPRLALTLQQPQLTLAADYTAAADGTVQLTAPTAQLVTADYNCTVSGAASLGRGLQAALNSNSAEVLQFITPSLEAALVRRVQALSEKELRKGVAGLRRIFDAVDPVAK